MDGEQVIDVGVEGAVERDGVGREERRVCWYCAVVRGVVVLVVEMDGDVEGVADKGT